MNNNLFERTKTLPSMGVAEIATIIMMDVDILAVDKNVLNGELMNENRRLMAEFMTFRDSNYVANTRGNISRYKNFLKFLNVPKELFDVLNVQVTYYLYSNFVKIIHRLEINTTDISKENCQLILEDLKKNLWCLHSLMMISYRNAIYYLDNNEQLAAEQIVETIRLFIILEKENIQEKLYVYKASNNIEKLQDVKDAFINSIIDECYIQFSAMLKKSNYAGLGAYYGCLKFCVDNGFLEADEKLRKADSNILQELDSKVGNLKDDKYKKNYTNGCDYLNSIKNTSLIVNNDIIIAATKLYAEYIYEATIAKNEIYVLQVFKIINEWIDLANQRNISQIGVGVFPAEIKLIVNVIGFAIDAVIRKYDINIILVKEDMVEMSEAMETCLETLNIFNVDDSIIVFDETKTDVGSFKNRAYQLIANFISFYYDIGFINQKDFIAKLNLIPKNIECGNTTVEDTLNRLKSATEPKATTIPSSTSKGTSQPEDIDHSVSQIDLDKKAEAERIKKEAEKLAFEREKAKRAAVDRERATKLAIRQKKSRVIIVSLVIITQLCIAVWLLVPNVKEIAMGVTHINDIISEIGKQIMSEIGDTSSSGQSKSNNIALRTIVSVIGIGLLNILFVVRRHVRKKVKSFKLLNKILLFILTVFAFSCILIGIIYEMDNKGLSTFIAIVILVGIAPGYYRWIVNIKRT